MLFASSRARAACQLRFSRTSTWRWIRPADPTGQKSNRRDLFVLSETCTTKRTKSDMINDKPSPLLLLCSACRRRRRSPNQVLALLVLFCNRSFYQRHVTLETATS